jgi:osmotically inducible protein OsmC
MATGLSQFYSTRLLLSKEQGIGRFSSKSYGEKAQGTSGKFRPFFIMNRKASVVWNGTLRQGTGTLTTESGVLNNTQYSFRTRFLQGIGTNPDELIAASLGGCFSMALSNELGLSGFHPQRIETSATATLEDLAVGWTLTRIQLDVRANVPLVSQAQFMKAALAAKTKCPVARLLNTTISMSASLNP